MKPLKPLCREDKLYSQKVVVITLRLMMAAVNIPGTHCVPSTMLKALLTSSWLIPSNKPIPRAFSLFTDEEMGVRGIESSAQSHIA